MNSQSSAKVWHRRVSILALACSVVIAGLVAFDLLPASGQDAAAPAMNLAMVQAAQEGLQGRDCASKINIAIEFGFLCSAVCTADEQCLEH